MMMMMKIIIIIIIIVNSIVFLAVLVSGVCTGMFVCS